MTLRISTTNHGVLVGAVGVSGGDSIQDQRAVDAGVRAFVEG